MRNLNVLRGTIIVPLLLVVMLAGCMKYVVHPGSANQFDSLAYDALRDAAAVIDTARPQLESGALSASLKPVLNALISAYDIARPVWVTYHDAAVAGKQVDVNQLQTDLNNLAAALAAFRKGK